MDIELLLIDVWHAVEPWFERAEAFVRAWADANTLGAFLFGVIATLARARLLIFGAAILLGAQAAVAVGYVTIQPAWLLPLSAALLIAGLVQGAAVTLLGEDGASQFLAFLLLGVLAGVMFVLWRGPRRLARGLWTRLGRREG